MDLHLTAARPAPEEQAAVDSELGPAESGWEGGQRRAEIDSRAAYGGAAKASDRRHLLLPVLHAIHRRVGWISPGALNYAALRLDVPPAEVHGVASFYGMFSLTPRPRVVAHVCDDIACQAGGAEALCSVLEKRLGPEGAPSMAGRATWLRSNCLGLCERAPAALVTKAGGTSKERVLAPAMPDRLQSLLDDAAADVMPKL